MTDIVEIARQHRVRFAAEIGKLDDFIRIAQALMKYSRGLDRVPVMDADSPAPGALLADSGDDTFRFLRDGGT